MERGEDGGVNIVLLEGYVNQTRLHSLGAQLPVRLLKVHGGGRLVSIQIEGP